MRASPDHAGLPAALHAGLRSWGGDNRADLQKDGRNRSANLHNDGCGSPQAARNRGDLVVVGRIRQGEAPVRRDALQDGR